MTDSSGTVVNGSPSNVVSSRPLLPAPTLTATSTAHGVNLRWNKVNNADAYMIYYRRGSTGSLNYLYVTDLTSYFDKSASYEVPTYYWVFASINDNGKYIPGTASNYGAGRALVPSANNLKAWAEVNQIRLGWTAAPKVDGYLIYRKIGDGAFTYRYVTTSSGFIDSTASHYETNFYRVYPYVLNAQGKKLLGAASNYVYGKALLPAVTTLKAKSQSNSIRLQWTSPGAAFDGYAIYHKEGSGGIFKYLTAVSASQTSYVHRNVSSSDYSFYRVYGYKNKNGKQAFGAMGNYVYGKAQGTSLKAEVYSRWGAGQISEGELGTRVFYSSNQDRVTWNDVLKAWTDNYYYRNSSGYYVTPTISLVELYRWDPVSLEKLHVRTAWQDLPLSSTTKQVYIATLQVTSPGHASLYFDMPLGLNGGNESYRIMTFRGHTSSSTRTFGLAYNLYYDFMTDFKAENNLPVRRSKGYVNTKVPGLYTLEVMYVTPIGRRISDTFKFRVGQPGEVMPLYTPEDPAPEPSTDPEIIEWERLKNEQINDFLTKHIKPGMSTYQKVEAMCRYISANYTYIEGGWGTYSLFLNKGGDCWGHCRAVVAFCDAMDIPAVSDLRYSYSHADNSVLIDGVWYQVDTSFADRSYTLQREYRNPFTTLSNHSLRSGRREDLRMTGLLSFINVFGGTDYDLTNTKMWHSSNPDIASVTNTGIVTAHKPGKTTISVHVDWFSVLPMSFELTVLP